MSDQEKWELLESLHGGRQNKRNLFQRFQAQEAKKKWVQWMNNPGGVSQNLGAFIRKMKRSPQERINLRMQNGFLTIIDNEVIVEMKRAWDLVHLERFWDNFDPSKVLIYTPHNFFISVDHNKYLNYDISTLEVDVAIKRIKPGTSAGVTDILPEAIRGLSEKVQATIWQMLQSWFEKKEVPNTVQSSKICLLHKSGRKDNVKNYRTLSVQCNLGKIFPTLLYTRLSSVVEDSKLLGEFQNGFHASRRAVDNLFILKTVHELAYHKVNKNKVFSAYIDLTKAYDRVNLQFLWCKMEWLGFS